VTFPALIEMRFRVSENPKTQKTQKTQKRRKTQKTQKRVETAIVTNKDGLIVEKAQKKFLGVFLGFCSPKTTLVYCVTRKRGRGSRKSKRPVNIDRN
jgi:hypothetical protein